MRARSIVRALRDFARPRPPQPVPTDLQELVVADAARDRAFVQRIRPDGARAGKTRGFDGSRGGGAVGDVEKGQKVEG